MWGGWESFHDGVHKTLGSVRHNSDNLFIVIFSVQRIPECGKKPRLVIVSFVIDDGEGYM